MTARAKRQKAPPGGMGALHRSGRATVQINVSFLFATIFGAASFWLWPGNNGWWATGLLGVLCGLIAVSMFNRAMRAIWKQVRRDRVLAAYLKSGASPKSADLASDEALRKAGMIP